MAVEHVTSWLQERKPKARVRYAGREEYDLHVWHLDFPDDAPSFHLGIPDEVLDSEGILAERLMVLQNQGWLDQAGEEEHWIVLNPGDLTAGAFE